MPEKKAATEIEKLADLRDSNNDDWQTEHAYDKAARQIADLFSQIEQGIQRGKFEVADFFTPNFSASRLRPSGAETRTLPPFKVWKLEINGNAAQNASAGHENIEPWLREWLTPFKELTQVRLEFDIFHVETLDEDHFSVDQHVQAFGASATGWIQQNATWTVIFEQNASEKGPRIQSIELREFSETQTTAKTFAECTNSILPNETTTQSKLNRGGNFWYGKMDAVGELNYLGHNGIAVGDVNGDGLEDLYVAMPTGIPNQLFLQNPDGTTREAGTESGVDWLDDSKGVLLIDYDNDGDKDLILAMGPAIVVHENDGRGNFIPKRELRAGNESVFYSLAAADYDLDGYLDIYATRYVKQQYGSSPPIPFHDANNGPTNHLLHNEAGRAFVDVTRQTGLMENNNRFSLAASWADYDNDGDPDLFVANDFGHSNLFRNDGGKFHDVASMVGVDAPTAAKGISWSDIDLDGNLDAFVSGVFSSAGQRISSQSRFKSGEPIETRAAIQNLSLGNNLYLNRGQGSLSNISDASGIRDGRWCFGAQFIDINNDGYDDIVLPNGFLSNSYGEDLDSFFWRRVVAETATTKNQPTLDYTRGWAAMLKLLDAGFSWNGRERNSVYLNLKDRSFSDISAISAVDFPEDGRSISLVDWNEDGKLDFWLRNRTGPQLRFLKNETAVGHFLEISLVGKTCNRDAIGARIELHAGDKKRIRELRAGEGFLSQSSSWIHFGLGDLEKIDFALVYWPGHSTPQEIRGLQVDRRYRIEQDREAAQEIPARKVSLLPAIAAEASNSEPVRIVLRTPLPMPPTFLQELDKLASKRALWIHLDSPTCTSCKIELKDIGSRYPEMQSLGLDIVGLLQAEKMDEASVPTRIATDGQIKTIQAILDHVRYAKETISPPLSMLVDVKGDLQIVYLGAVSPKKLLQDSITYGNEPDQQPRSQFPGRWYFGMSRDLVGLAHELRIQGNSNEAEFYLNLSRSEQQRFEKK